MKLITLLALSLLSFSTFADPNCSSLSQVAGVYKKVSQTCTGFGNEFTVEPFQTSHFDGYTLGTAGLNVQVTTSNISDDKCTSEDNSIVVTSCLSGPCFPKNWIYTFKGNQLLFSADSCFAEYIKIEN